MNERRKVLDRFEEHREYTKKRINDGIEKYRKGDAEITLFDENGNVLEGAEIKVTQKNHEFKFGANIFMLEELETKEKNELYKKYFADIFNIATLPFYWSSVEPERNKPRYDKDSPKLYRRPPIDLCMEFCEEHGIEPREHGLAYEHFFPSWLKDGSVNEIKKAFENRCREISERYADRISTIEVTNEMEWAEGTTAFYDEPDFIEWCFKTAEKYFPNNQLCINEHQQLAWGDRGRATDKYYAYTEAAILKGARVDAIGSQFHMFHHRDDEYDATRAYYNPIKLFKCMDLYSRFGKPLQITEVTIPAYSNDATDEAIQAEIIEKLYSIWFSHPNVEQIIYWNLVDGYAYVADATPENIAKTQGDMTIGENYFYGGLIRFDMTPKPAYYKIKELIKKRWHTEAECITDENGKFNFRGFYGDYDLEILHNGKRANKKITLSKNKENAFKIIV